METDRELLALAAKAAGKKRADWDYVWLSEQRTDVSRDMLWDPRRDNSKAFELCVNLDITVSEIGGRMQAEYVVGGTIVSIEEPFTYDDPVDRLRAARMAAFRAAVEIGRAMP